MPVRIAAKAGPVRARQGRAEPNNGAGLPRRARGQCTIAVAARPRLFREILAIELGNHPGLEVTGQARNEEEIRLILKRRRPAILLFDYEGLGPGGEGVIRRLRAIARGTRVLVLARRSGDETVERVLRAGASGLVGKQQPFKTLVRAIQAVDSGELWANRHATAHLVERLSDPSYSSPDGQLTSREQEIADAVGRGLRNKEIARHLNITEKTVKSHLNNIFRKLGVDNRFSVGLYALDLGLKT
jgi:DNA-binding NarL/FixJ family response regulator